jgi:hypothetical protein
MKTCEEENAMNEQSNVPMTSAAPEPFYQVWMKAISRPSEHTYAALVASPNARSGTAYLWYFIGATVSWLLSALVPNQAYLQMMQEYIPSDGQLDPSVIGGSLISALCGAPVAGAIGTLFFAIGVAIIQWIAKMFGGRGNSEQLAYAFSAILTPFLFISGVLTLLSAVPYAGLCFSGISLLAGLYALVLEIMAVKGVNQFGWGEAIGSVLIPSLVVVFFCACLVIGGLMVMGPAISEIFNQINQSLQ